MARRLRVFGLWRCVPALLAGACTTVGPDFEAIEPELPASYNASLPAVFQGQSFTDDWWTLFEDPVLSALIDEGREAGIDVRLALSRAREARALARGVAAESLPQIDAGTEAVLRYEDQSRGSSDGLGGDVGAFLEGTLEIDVFGRLERQEEAAWARSEQQETLAREARRLTSAEITRTYIDLRAVERRIELGERSLELQHQTLELVEERVGAGLAPGLDRARARAAVATIEAGLAPLRGEAERLRNALAVLLDRPPGALSGQLATPAPIPAANTGATLGVPADIARRRPDIQAAELNVAAATADVGVAVADLYPRLTLPGMLDVARIDVGGADAVSTVVASLAAMLQVPIYDGGLRRAQVDAAEERVIQATLQYRDVTLAALEQIEAALVAYQASLARREALQRSVENNRAAFEQSQILYSQGLATFLDVLDSQRAWNAAQQDLATAAQEVSLAVAELLSALGSGR